MNQSEIVKAVIDQLKKSKEKYYTDTILMSQFNLKSIAHSKRIMQQLSRLSEQELDIEVVYSLFHTDDDLEYEIDFSKQVDILGVLQDIDHQRIKGISIFAIGHSSMDIGKLLVVNKSDFDDFSRIRLQNSKLPEKQSNSIKPVQIKGNKVSPMDMFKRMPQSNDKNQRLQLQSKKKKGEQTKNLNSKKLLSDSQYQDQTKELISKKKKNKKMEKIDKIIQKKLVQDVNQAQKKFNNDYNKQKKNYLLDNSIYTTNENDDDQIDNSQIQQQKRKKKQTKKNNDILDPDNSNSMVTSKKQTKKQKKQKLIDSEEENQVEKEMQSEQSNFPKTKKVKMTQVCKETITFKDQEGYLVTKQISKEKEYWAEVKVPTTPTRKQPPKNATKLGKDSKSGQSTRSLSSYFKKAQ